jgi:riboflavin kinase/FMN adenylyltransferase
MIQRPQFADNLAAAPDRQPTYVALGSFDGVHLGHQAVIGRMVEAARTDGVRSAVLTFFPHPKRFIRAEHGRYYINTLADRVALIAAQGVDLVITHPFDESFRLTRAADFVDQLLAALDMRQIWGGRITFGYQREGTIEYLQRVGPEKGFSVQAVSALVTYDDKLVSSSRVRHGLAAGDMADVNGCLGREYSLSGVVVRGDQRGRTIGFPTANLAVWDELLLPADGVYAAYTWVGGQRYMTATNVGVRPTINGRERTVEAHILDFEGDLYGQTLRLAFVERIRGEQRFAGLQELQARIQTDVGLVRERLSASSL